MKIVLMTIWHEKNFGAEMQCYATVRALQSLNHEVEVIDFRISDNPVSSLKQKVRRILEKCSPETKSFNLFWEKYIPTTRHYSTEKDLKSNPPSADLYLVGSDQVWNPEITKNKWDAYFLSFVPSYCRKSAYASSFGVSEWKWPSIKRTVGDRLSEFHRIGVREDSGKEILMNEFNIKGHTVIDPTLLHDNYNEIVTPRKNKSILTYYPLSENIELKNYAEELALEMGLHFVDTNVKKYLFGSFCWKRTTIQEWIRNIAESSFVVTPSFHGLAFSLIYKKQFVIIQPSSYKSRSTRITGLLKELNLSDRYFSSIESAKDSRIWEKHIDYNKVYEKLQELRNNSWNFLKEIVTE